MKPLSAGDYVVRPFLTHKQQSYIISYLSGSNPAQVSIDLAVSPPASWAFVTSSEARNADLTYQHTLYASVRHLFYGSGSIWSSGPTGTKGFFPSAPQFYVVNMAQSSYGESIQRGTFKITSPVTTASLQDDGLGRIVSSGNTSSICGNIFYELGIAVVRLTTGSLSGSVLTSDGMYLVTGSQTTVSFKATHTIYEHRIVCTITEGEGNYSTNPSMRGIDPNGIKIFDGFASGTLTPYMTTIGCYTDEGELVATAKFPRPIKRAPETSQTVIIRFDV